jgi:acyl-homoserine-lactone acylase
VRTRAAAIVVLFMTAVLSVCVSVPAVAVGGGRGGYDVTIRWTAYGIPHVTAGDWGSLGYGYGYALAQDNLCELALDVVRTNGEQARWFGSDQGRLDEDFFYRSVKDAWTVERLIARPPDAGGVSPAVHRLVAGYAAGYNRYLRERGVDHLGDPRCTGQPWVRDITEMDLWRTYYRSQLFAGSVALLPQIVGAEPPVTGTASAASSAQPTEATQPTEPGTARDLSGLALLASPLSPPTAARESDDLGSNAIALGSEATVAGDGMLLANPHLPWDGPQRFYEAHLTIPGRYDVIGASLLGQPLIQTGHNADLGWSHTVSTAQRFTLAELRLVPDRPTSYYWDGQVRDMSRQDVTVDVLGADGRVTHQTHTFWRSHLGPIIGFDPLTWGTTTAWALRDVNEETTTRSLDGYIAIGQAHTVRELQTALDRWQPLPWVNTVAADQTGETYYADNSVIPHVTDEEFEACATPIGRVAAAQFGVVILDGSRSACDWGSDPDANRPGIFGPSRLPQLFRPDYVTNSNDSYWLSNPNQPLTGFDRIIGDENTGRSLRTRLGLRLVAQRLDGSDGLGGTGFTRDQLQTAMFNDRIYGAELVVDDLVQACRTTPTVQVDGQTVDLTQACDVLARWDRHVNLDSRGAHLFEMFGRLRGLSFAVPFDPADPIGTPNTLARDPTVLQALGRAVLALRDLGIPLDAALGDIQTEPRGDERIPIHGGDGNAGAFNVVAVAFPRRPAGFSDIAFGSSFVLVAELGPHGPRSRAVLTYSQSTDPTSPHYADQTRLYSHKQWVDLPFTPRDVRAATLQKSTLQGR